MTQRTGGLRDRTLINGPLLLVSTTLGAVVGLAGHLVDDETFSWWFVPACSFGGLMALAAFVRRHRWEERSTAAAMGAVVVAAPLVGESPWFLFCALLLFAAYWWLLVVADNRRRGP